MADGSRKVSILLNMELDQKVTKDEGEEIANRLEAVPREELWSSLLEEAGVGANLISVDAELVELEEEYDEEGEDEPIDDDPDDEASDATDPE